MGDYWWPRYWLGCFRCWLLGCPEWEPQYEYAGDQAMLYASACPSCHRYEYNYESSHGDEQEELRVAADALNEIVDITGVQIILPKASQHE